MSHIFRCLSLVSLCSFSLAAQNITGTIQGTISDASGAVLPNVAVTAKNLGTNQIRQTQTNGTGNYIIPLLQVGGYEVTAELSGFKTAVKTGIELQVEQRLNVSFGLEIGAMSDKLTVTEAASLIQADEATVGNVVDSQKLVELPLNGRRFSQVALLVPAATTLAAGNLMSRPERDAFSVAGLPNTANYYMIDGIDNNDISINIAASKPSIDSIREYKMLSGTYSAEFGHGGGAQINVITKSGSNRIHGTIYEFLRNSALDARNYFDRADLPIPAFRRNQFGMTLGGALRKDRTFFFVSDEELYVVQGITVAATTATAAARSGNFAGQAALKDPFNSNAPFASNIIPLSRQDPSGIAIAKLFPDPNYSGGTLNFISSPPDRLTWHQPSARLDHTFSPKDTAFLRVNKNHLQTNIAFDPGTSNFPGFGKNSRTISTNIGLVETHVFSPSLINEARIGYNFFREEQPNQNLGFDATEKLLGIKGTSRDPHDFAYPYFSITGLSSIGDRTASPQDRKVPNYQYYDAVTWIRGAHNIKVGGEFHRIQNNFNWQSTRRGSFTFTGRYSGIGLADVLLGVPSTTALNLGNSQRYFRQTNLDWFIQDDWKFNRRLTVNLGLRYEVNTPPEEKFNIFSNFNPQKNVVEIAGQNGVARGFYNTDLHDFGPRIGLAYSATADGRTVARVGYGIYYDQAQNWTNVLTGSAGSVPFIQAYTFNASTTTADITLRDPFPTRSANAAPTIFSEVKNYPTAYVQQYSAGIQREMSPGTVVEVSFLGNKTTHGSIQRQINAPAPGAGSAAVVAARRPFPAYGNIGQWQPGANSNYNAGILRVERRFSKGLTFLSSYTWSKSIWDQATPDPNNYRAGHGPSPIDNKGRFVFSSVYELPFMKGSRWIGGWQVSGVVALRSPQAYTPTLSADNSNTTLRTDRPLAIGDPNDFKHDPRAGWWNKAALIQPALYTYGNAGNGVLRGPAFRNVDISLAKNFRIVEGTTLEFRAETFNIANHPNFGSPATVWDSATFGTISSALDSRQTQFGLKLVF